MGLDDLHELITGASKMVCTSRASTPQSGRDVSVRDLRLAVVEDVNTDRGPR